MGREMMRREQKGGQVSHEMKKGESKDEGVRGK